MNAKNRLEEMLHLRDEGRSLAYIGELYGVSRERVRQIIGNTGLVVCRENENKLRKLFNDCGGEKESNAKIAEKMGKTAEYVSHLRQRLGIRVHHPVDGYSKVAVGNRAEIFVSDLLKSRGTQNNLMPLGSVFDILCENGCRIDVKTTISAGKTNLRIKSPQWRFGIKSHKLKAGTCDVFFCVIPEDRYFVVPCEKAKINMAICWPTNYNLFKYGRFFMNLEPIENFSKRSSP